MSTTLPNLSALDELDLFNESGTQLSDLENLQSLNLTNTTLNSAGIEPALASPRPSPSDSADFSKSTLPSWLQGLIDLWSPETDASVSILPDIVAIIIGIVLIAGAVWGFSTVRDTTISVAKKGAEIAAA